MQNMINYVKDIIRSGIKIVPVTHRDFIWPEEYHEELDEDIRS